MIPGGSSDPYYDLFDDWDLVVSSFLSQYGLRLSTKEFESVSWEEFKSLLAGIDPETVLGRVVAIRSEKDKKIIEQFTPEQRKIHNGWRDKKASKMSQETFEKEMQNLENMFAHLFG